MHEQSDSVAGDCNIVFRLRDAATFVNRHGQKLNNYKRSYNDIVVEFQSPSLQNIRLLLENDEKEKKRKRAKRAREWVKCSKINSVNGAIAWRQIFALFPKGFDIGRTCAQINFEKSHRIEIHRVSPTLPLQM